MTARTGDVIETAARVLSTQTTCDGQPWPTEVHQRQARALAAEGLLATRPVTRDEIADELAGWLIGSGYYSMSVPVDEAQAMADAVLALLEGGER